MKTFQREIFGAMYTFEIGTREDVGLDPKFSGDTDVYTKVVRVATDVDPLNEDGRQRVMMEKVMLHELCHAAMYETGLIEFFDSETMVEWLEVMLPKLNDLWGMLSERMGSAVKHIKEDEQRENK